MSHFETYERLLTTATNLGHQEMVFWRSLLEAHRANRLDIDDIRGLIHSTSITRTRPSRATTYRLLERWTDVLADMDNPGRGA